MGESLSLLPLTLQANRWLASHPATLLRERALFAKSRSSHESNGQALHNSASVGFEGLGFCC
jgi:hypothetical protein